MSFIPTWIAALAAGASVLWQQVKNTIQLLLSFVLVRAVVVDVEGRYFVPFLRANFKQLSIGSRTFNYRIDYIIPIKKYQTYAVEHVGSSLVFLNGWRPLFVSGAEGERANDTAVIRVSFIRGTFSMEDLLRRSAEFKIREDGSRFRVIHYPGSDELAVPEKSRNFSRDTDTPIGWKYNDIGIAPSDNPFCGLEYSDSVLSVMGEVERWVSSKEWYESHSLNWRYGMLLHGLPGKRLLYVQ